MPRRQLFFGRVTSDKLLVGVLIAAGAACSTRSPVSARSSALWDVDPNTGSYVDHSDVDDIDHNVVVSLSKTADGPGDCTGILISPRLVLTTASCLVDGKAGATPAVRVGAAVPFRQIVTTAQTLSFAADPTSEPSLSGQDLALVVLSDFVFEAARPRHPSLVAPTPTSGPSSNGTDTFANLVLTGWSHLDSGGQDLGFAQGHRQVALDSMQLLWPYASVSPSNEPFWVMKPYTDIGFPKTGLAAGDSGAPLLSTDGSGQWSLMGIASIIGDPPDPALRGQALPAVSSCAPITPGTATSCDAWIDITANGPRSWILASARDMTRSARWLASHPRLSTAGNDGALWIGDVDYAGPCDSTQDPDCDHVYTLNPDDSARDNCPETYNPGQQDTGDAGEGDACNFTNCTSNVSSDPMNCGACGHECIGGSCVAGQCTGVSGSSYAPAAAWLSCGGGSFTSQPDSEQLNISISAGIVGPVLIGSNSSMLTLGFFSNDF